MDGILTCTDESVLELVHAFMKDATDAFMSRCTGCASFVLIPLVGTDRSDPDKYGYTKLTPDTDSPTHIMAVAYLIEDASEPAYVDEVPIILDGAASRFWAGNTLISDTETAPDYEGDEYYANEHILELAAMYDIPVYAGITSIED